MAQRPLRLVHVISTPSGFGGAEEVLRHLTRGSLARGHEVVVLNPFAASAADVAAGRAFYAPVRYEARCTTSPAQLPGAARWLDRQVAGARPDLLHTHLFHAGLLAAGLPRHGALRLTTHHHGALLSWRGGLLLPRADRWATRRADHVVAVSDAVAKHVAGVGVPPARITTIRNGWSGVPEPHLGSPSGHTVTCVANLREEKGHEVLLEAFRQVRTQVPDARLVLAGDGPRRTELTELAGRLGLRGAVELRGRVPDVWGLLAQSDVFALSAWQEPLGIAALEAMAAGLPVVVTAVGGLPEIVPPTAGALVAAGDADRLAHELTRLLRDPAQRAAASAAGREQAARTTATAMVEAYTDLYDQLISHAGLRRD